MGQLDKLNISFVYGITIIQGQQHVKLQRNQKQHQILLDSLKAKGKQHKIKRQRKKDKNWQHWRQRKCQQRQQQQQQQMQQGTELLSARRYPVDGD